MHKQLIVNNSCSLEIKDATRALLKVLAETEHLTIDRVSNDGYRNHYDLTVDEEVSQILSAYCDTGVYSYIDMDD